MSSTTTTTTQAAEPSSHPAQGRKQSTVGKMFGSFKFGDKSQSRDRPDEKKDESSVTVHEVDDPPRQGSYASPRLGGGDPKRKLSTVIHDVFRRGSAEGQHSDDDPARGMSVSSGHRKHSFWQMESSNPDYDSMDPPRSASVVSAAGSDPAAPMRTYTPKNAARSFLKTSNGTNEDRESALQQHTAMQAAAATAPHPRPAAPMTPIADASPAPTPAHESAPRRQSSLLPSDTTTPRSRRASARRSSAASGSIKPVTMAPEAYSSWQASVSKSLTGGAYARPGETDAAAPRRDRMHSVASALSWSSSSAGGDEGRPAMHVRTRSAGSQGRNAAAAAAEPARAGSDPAVGTSPRFRPALRGGVSEADEGAPVSPLGDAELERLGFRGAVSANPLRS